MSVSRVCCVDGKSGSSGGGGGGGDAEVVIMVVELTVSERGSYWGFSLLEKMIPKWRQMSVGGVGFVNGSGGGGGGGGVMVNLAVSERGFCLLPEFLSGKGGGRGGEGGRGYA